MRGQRNVGPARMPPRRTPLRLAMPHQPKLRHAHLRSLLNLTTRI
jgi:hypothetical protein